MTTKIVIKYLVHLDGVPYGYFTTLEQAEAFRIVMGGSIEEIETLQDVEG